MDTTLFENEFQVEYLDTTLFKKGDSVMISPRHLTDRDRIRQDHLERFDYACKNPVTVVECFSDLIRTDNGIALSPNWFVLATKLLSEEEPEETAFYSTIAF